MKRIFATLLLAAAVATCVVIWRNNDAKASERERSSQKSTMVASTHPTQSNATPAAPRQPAPTTASAAPAASTPHAVGVAAKSDAPGVPPESLQSGTKAYPPLSLAAVLGPNRLYHDDLFGVSMTFPEGWTVRAASRWGTDNEQNTVWFQPPAGNRAQPSMYYQKYPNGAPAMDNAEAMLREMAQQKEASRQQSVSDYQNDPDSFVFRTVDGHPALSYFATYSQAGQQRAEYFMRILGPTGYVMFFVRGSVNDVQSLIPSVYQAGSTVRPP